MVGHEAVGCDVEAEAVGVFLEEGEIESAVVVGKKDVLAVVAALGDVVGDAGKDDASKPRHGRILGLRKAIVKIIGDCPQLRIMNYHE
jgi:hypothetical protein